MGDGITIISFWYRIVVTEPKIENKIYKLGKIDRIPILQQARSRSTEQKGTEIWIEKDGFKPGSRIDWKIVERF